MRSACTGENMLVSWVCLQEQRKQIFLTLAKEKQSPLGLSKFSNIFLYNPYFVLLIRDQCLVLLSLLRASAFITNHSRMCSAYVLHHPPERLACMDVIFFLYGYFSYKNTLIVFIHHPPEHVRHILLWMDALYCNYFELLMGELWWGLQGRV